MIDSICCISLPLRGWFTSTKGGETDPTVDFKGTLDGFWTWGVHMEGMLKIGQGSGSERFETFPTKYQVRKTCIYA